MPEGLVRGAVLSEDKRYRYRLLRRWGPAQEGVCFIMLNPSIADASIDDPTIKRCMKFTERLGYTAMTVVNLFGLRSTDPEELLHAPDPVGPLNHDHVRAAIRESRIHIAAWGAVKQLKLRGAVDAMAKIIAEEGRSMKCLGKTKDGFPKHPLYLKADAPLMDF